MACGPGASLAGRAAADPRLLDQRDPGSGHGPRAHGARALALASGRPGCDRHPQPRRGARCRAHAGVDLRDREPGALPRPAAGPPAGLGGCNGLPQRRRDLHALAERPGRPRGLGPGPAPRAGPRAPGRRVRASPAAELATGGRRPGLRRRVRSGAAAAARSGQRSWGVSDPGRAVDGFPESPERARLAYAQSARLHRVDSANPW